MSPLKITLCRMHPLLGSETVTIDGNRRVRLPPPWTRDTPRQWLLFPPHLLRRNPIMAGWLRLVPMEFAHPSEYRLARAAAFEFGLPAQIVTTFSTTPTRNRIPLTQAQLDWLAVRDGTVFVSGLVVAAQLCSPLRWADWVARSERASG